MDARQQEALVQRLVANPQDQAAIAEAHASGQRDPEGYAQLLEKVGLATPQASVASHWLNEAANVWLTTFQDPRRATNALLHALDRDPASELVMQRLTEFYGDDAEGLASAHQRRADAMAAFAEQEPDWRPQAAAAYESLGQLWADAPLADSARAKAAYSRAIDLDPTSQFAIYNLRELHKAAGEYAEALPYFGMEIALTTDAERKRALLGDEIEVAKRAGRGDRAIAALREVLRLDPEDPGLRQKLGSALLERYRSGELLEAAERREGCELFVGLAEQYPGEHGFLYALCGLELLPEHDRAVQLAIHFGEQLGRMPEVGPLAAAYVRDNPQGVMIEAARQAAGGAVPTAAPRASTTGASEAPLQAVRPKPTTRSAAVRPPDGVSVEQLLEQADELAQRSRKNEAIATYRQVLDLDPVNPDALNYLLEVLTIKKKYADLRDVLLGAIDSPEALDDDRLEWLRELAGVCESHVRDIDTAVYAWQRILEIDPDDDEAYDHIKRILEKARRWDQLAQVLRVESDRTEDVEASIAIERQLIKIHTTRRKDLTAAGEAWARIATLSPGDEGALQEAVRCFEKSERGDLAADTIAEHVAELDDDDAKRELYRKLGELRVAQGQLLAAAEALETGAETLEDAEMWGAAEDYFVRAQAWERAARAADEHAQLLEDGAPRARLLARAASHYRNVGEVDEAVARLEKAVEFAPSEEEYANSLEELLISSERVQELVQLFLTRAAKLTDTEARVHLRKRAAITQRDHMEDPVAARASFLLVLQDVEDEETLLWLAGEAEERDDAEMAVGYLRRLTEAVTDAEQKIRHSLREAELQATKLVDVDAAAERYEHILELDEHNVAALEALGELEVARGNHERAAEVLERYIGATEDRRIKLDVASRLAELYELHLAKPEEAMRLLRFVHETDPDDLDATQRLCELAEASGEWSLVADLTKELIAVEGDDEQISEMTRRLAQILHLQLSKGEEALAVLGKVADSGDEACRRAFTELGDELGEKAEVAARLVSWFENAPDSPEKSEALHGAFRRYVEAQQSEQAIAVATSLSSFGLADPEIAEPLEKLAVEARDRAALSLAHELRVVDLLPTEVGPERVRQAEVLVRVGAGEAEAIEHGELALADVERDELEGLLTRLAALCSEAGAKVDVYERQIARFQSLEDRVAALVRAADVAVDVGDKQRAASLFEAALGQGLESERLDQMVSLALAADGEAERKTLREILVEALATGGQAARDGGRTRSNMLRLAAHLAHTELDDVERAFQYLGDGLILHVADEGLEALEELAGSVGDFSRAETVLTRALGEVFDGPLVRRLLARRASLREERLSDLVGASEDLKQLHDLSPTDADVNTKLTALYEQLGDNQGLVNLIEDQILRSRDKDFRAELSRKVARLWQSELDDPREAADAWRRVIRLTKDDEEAKAGLAAAKEAMLNARRSEPVSEANPTAADASAQEDPSPPADAQSSERAADSESAASDEEPPPQDPAPDSSSEAAEQTTYDMAIRDADDRDADTAKASDAGSSDAGSSDSGSSDSGTAAADDASAANEGVEASEQGPESVPDRASADPAPTSELPQLDEEETTTSGSMFDSSQETDARIDDAAAEHDAPIVDPPPDFSEGDFDALTEITSNPGELLSSDPPTAAGPTDTGPTDTGPTVIGGVEDEADDAAPQGEPSEVNTEEAGALPSAPNAVATSVLAEMAEPIAIDDDDLDVADGEFATSVPPPKPPPRRSATPPPPRVAPAARRSGLPPPPRRRAVARENDE